MSFKKIQWMTPEHLPSPFFAFSLLTCISLAQIPASRLIQGGSLSLGVLINEWGVLTGLTAGILSLAKTDWKRLIPLQKTSPKAFGYVFIMTLALCVIIDDLTFFSEQLIPLPEIYKQFLDKVLSVGSVPEGLWKWFLLCITPALCEEFFFRGILQISLSRRIGIAWGVGLTAFFFALIHGNPWYFHLYLLLGFYLCWLLWIGKNLWLPIFAHFLNNSWTYGNHLWQKPNLEWSTWTGTDSLILTARIIILAFAACRFREVTRF